MGRARAGHAGLPPSGSRQPSRFGMRHQILGVLTMNISLDIASLVHCELSGAHQRNAGHIGVLHVVIGLVLVELHLVDYGTSYQGFRSHLVADFVDFNPAASILGVPWVPESVRVDSVAVHGARNGVWV